MYVQVCACVVVSKSACVYKVCVYECMYVFIKYVCVPVLLSVRVYIFIKMCVHM